MGWRTGVGQADKDDLRLHAKVAGARVQRRLQGVARVQAAAHMQASCQTVSLDPATVLVVLLCVSATLSMPPGKSCTAVKGVVRLVAGTQDLWVMVTS